MKLYLILAIALTAPLYGPCSKSRPQPQPTPFPTIAPTPEPTIAPSPVPSASPSIPIAWATPVPTPAYDPASYIPPATTGVTVRVQGEEGEDYAAKIQAAQNDPAVGTVIVGPGSLKRSTVWRKHTKLELPKGSVLSCDQTGGIDPWTQTIPHSDYGCILLADGVWVEGTRKTPQVLIDYFNAGLPRDPNNPLLQAVQALTDEQLIGDTGVVLEPNFAITPAHPGVIVFQSYNDVEGSHTQLAKNIAITGVVIKGRQTVYDGGVRSAISLGNCHNCTVQNSALLGGGSIGFTSGGSGLEKNNFSDGVLFWRNAFSRVAAANMAAVNSENVLVIENYVRKPGQPQFGGGVCGFDLETNSPADHSKNIQVFNNLFDYEDAGGESKGSAVCLQDPYTGIAHGKVVAANNVIIGGRNDIVHRYMSNGIFVVGLKQCEIVNNYVFRTGQNAIQGYNLEGCLIQDNDFEMTGGGGNPTIHFTGVRTTVLRRNYFRSRPNLAINAHAGIDEIQGSCGNRYEDYRIDGRVAEPAPSSACP